MLRLLLLTIVMLLAACQGGYYQSMEDMNARYQTLTTDLADVADRLEATQTATGDKLAAQARAFNRSAEQMKEVLEAQPDQLRDILTTVATVGGTAIGGPAAGAAAGWTADQITEMLLGLGILGSGYGAVRQTKKRGQAESRAAQAEAKAAVS